MSIGATEKSLQSDVIYILSSLGMLAYVKLYTRVDGVKKTKSSIMNISVSMYSAPHGSTSNS